MSTKNQLMRSLFFLFITLYCSKNFCAMPVGDSEQDKKVSSAVSKARHFLEIQGDTGIFSKDDLKEVPFATQKYDDLEEVYFLVNTQHKIPLPIGIVSFIIENESSASLEKLGVHAAYRKKGYGHMLLTHVLSCLKGRGISKLTVISTSEAIAFYRKRNFNFCAMGCLERTV